ncbi:MAG: hypothetical protein GY846_11215 [Deltaproteobacteria bacterium]|nr:hypothetical protein [Deltaproteobacteria bacterium]
MTVKALAHKEWLKLKKIWWIVLGINMAVFGYFYIQLNHLFTVEHAEMIWYRAFEIGSIHYEPIQYLMVLTGTLMGLAQFIPEMIGHRFRLSLHLPLSENVMVLLSLLVGLLAVVVIGILDVLCLYTVLGAFFPAEGALSGLLTAMPWFYAGFVVYLGTALVILEPQLFRKLVCLFVTVGFVWIFFQGETYESFNRAFWAPALISLLFIPAVLLPARRYRNRRAL